MMRMTPARLYDLLDAIPADRPRRIEYPSGRGHVTLAGRDVHAGDDRGRTTISCARNGKSFSIAYDRILGAVSGILPNEPVHMDTLLGAAGNDRTVMTVLLLETGEFKYHRDGGRLMIVWTPGQPHPPGRRKQWNPLTRGSSWRSPGQADIDVAIRSAMEGGIYERERIEEICISLATRHVAISGPPGCGKNHLVRLLADGFGVEVADATAEREWGAHSLMGQMVLGNSGARFVPGPFLQAVDRGVSLGRPVWFVIDECNRCELDQVFGQLFTLMGSGFAEHGMTFAPGLDPDGGEHVIPPGFRIIMCFNDYDGDSIHGISSAIRRRFAMHGLRLPQNGNDGLSNLREWEFVTGHVAQHAVAAGTGADPAEVVLAAVGIPMRRVIGLVREHIGVIGTAQALAWAAGYCSMHYLLPGGDSLHNLDRCALSSIVGELESDSVSHHLQRAVGGIDIRGLASEIAAVGLPMTSGRILALGR